MYARLYRSGSLWKDEFQLIELDEVTCQRGDPQFTNILCRIRTGNHIEEDLQILKSREVTLGDANYPHSALHVYRINADVDSRNQTMLNDLAHPK